MRDAVFDVDGRQGSEWPEEIMEIGIQEHGSDHTLESVIMALRFSVLLGAFRYGPLVLDPLLLAEFSEFAFNIFGGIVNSEEADLLAVHLLGNLFKTFEVPHRL